MSTLLRLLTRRLARRGPRVPCVGAGRPGAHDQVRPPQQRRPPGELWRQALRRAVGRQERRQAEGAGVPRLHAGQRDAAAVGAAGRRAGDVGTRHHVAGRHRQGVRPDRLPLCGRQLRAGRCLAGWALRPGVARQAAREGPGRPRLLGPRLSQRDQQQAADHQARGPGWPEAARDSEPGVPRHLQGLQGEPGADAVCRAVRRARGQGRRRPGESVRRHPVEQVLRGAEVRQRDQPRLRRQHRAGQQALLGSAVAGRAEAGCTKPRTKAAATSAR